MTSDSSLPMMTEKSLLLVLDGHAMVHRAWHGIQQPLSLRKTGEDVRAVYGFLNTFLRTVADWRPTHCAIAFDLSDPTFRHVQYDKYKEHRPPTPPELRRQFEYVREIMDVFKVPILDMSGYEADDVIGTLCHQAEEHQIKSLILTGDTDTLQLVSSWVRVLMTSGAQKKTVYDELAVRGRYGGLGPSVIADFKALQGDSSDNIPGVPGIGEKTAIRLLTEFGTLTGIMDNLDKVSPSRIRKSLEQNRELVILSKDLTTIVKDVPLEWNLEAMQFGMYDRSKVVDLLTDFEFFSIVPRVPNNQGEDSVLQGKLDMALIDHQETECVLVDTTESLEAMKSEISTGRGFAFKVETDSNDPMEASLTGISFSNRVSHGWYLPVGHDEGHQLQLNAIIESLGCLFEDENIPKITHQANFEMMILENYGIKIRNFTFDTMLAAHVLGRRAIGLEELALECLHKELTPLVSLLGTGRNRITMAQVSIDKAAKYGANNVAAIVELQSKLSEEIADKKMTGTLNYVELPLVPVLVRMQLNGIALDVDLLKQMSTDLRAKLSLIENEMYGSIGHEFNINSSQQLGDILFKELRLPHTKRTKHGYSTDASSLEGLKRQLDFGKLDGADPKARYILDSTLEYRQLSKIKSTYLDSLPTLVNPKTGRVHTNYKQTGSATGRISSNYPNVQNIPVRTELGRVVREAFVTHDMHDYLLLSADYSQIELRVLAHLSRDASLIDAFENKEDIHSATAASLYGVEIAEISDEMRRIAKVMNFGVIYGLSPFGISQQTGFSAEEGRGFIENYLSKYPGINEYIESTKIQVRRDGYAETLMKRRRYIPEIISRNFRIRSAGERMAINMPIQGTAADIIKIAMINIQERMDENNMQSMMIIQVHDELIFEVFQEEMGEMKDIIQELMPAAMELAVPLDVEIKAGINWGRME